MNILDYNTITPTSHPAAFLNEKRIIYLDASALAASNGCLRSLYLNSVCGLRLNRDNKKAPMFFGSAVHKFIAECYRTNDHHSALQRAHSYYTKPECQAAITLDDFHTTSRLELACNKYFNQVHRPNILNIAPIAVELPFRIPLIETDRVIVVLVGTIDLLGKYPNNQLVILDHKTTGKKMSNTDSYFMSLQLALYTLAVKKIIGTMATYAQDLPIICKINHFLVNKSEIAFYTSSDIIFPDDYLVQLNEFIYRRANELAYPDEKALSRYEGFLTANCQKLYGTSCSFFDLCRPDMQELRSSLVTSQFNTLFYNPLTFGDASE